MSGSVYGRILRMSTFGESHGPALGVVVDGFPAGVPVTEDDIQAFLDRRSPGRSEASTARKESDTAEILSGVFEGRSTGAPIAMLIRNTSQRSADYDTIKDLYRPGHADYTWDSKYGFRDYRGGGRSSGRETAGRVAAGALCMLLLNRMGITCEAWTSSIGEVTVPADIADRALRLTTQTYMPDAEADRRAMELIKKLKSEGNTVGGTVTCVMDHVPSGVGDPVFDKLDASLAAAVMSVGAVKAVEIGDGIAVSKRTGSENNDPFLPGDPSAGEKAVKATNSAGGILGGISDGSPIVLKAHIKPTPSIAMPQSTVDRNGRAAEISVPGRHDPVIVPRAVVVIECMCAFTLLDAMLVNMTSRADSIAAFYGR
ncbi:MAG: chorismate synthase [Lachnospiraceae bacterium]|nr:chorismate synthase [Lachnospiraceae bacterium]